MLNIFEKVKDRKVLIAAHRGTNGGNIPCNSVESYQIALNHGADIIELIGKKNWGKGVKVMITDNEQINIDCNVIIYYGHSVVSVASAVQEAVLNAVHSSVGVAEIHVNVNVCGIVRQ